MQRLIPMLTRSAAAAALIALALPVAALAAQPKTAPPSLHERGVAPAPGPAEQANAEQVRSRLDDLLRQYPPSVGRVLALDPTLIDNATYLEPYPELASFLAAHP